MFSCVNGELMRDTYIAAVCTGEQWLEKTQVVYNAKAQEAGVYVLQACGFDSICADMGLLHSKKQFDGIVV